MYLLWFLHCLPQVLPDGAARGVSLEEGELRRGLGDAAGLGGDGAGAAGGVEALQQGDQLVVPGLGTCGGRLLALLAPGNWLASWQGLGSWRTAASWTAGGRHCVRAVC